MVKNELGARVLELIPEALREDLIEEIKHQLIAAGEVNPIDKKGVRSCKMTGEEKRTNSAVSDLNVTQQ